MRTKVQRWGNSLAVRIPKVFAEEMGLVVDSAVDLRVCDGKLVVEPALAPAPTLADLAGRRDAWQPARARPTPARRPAARSGEAGYAPERGDVVWLATRGRWREHEQSGRRPWLVVSPAAYNGRVGLALLCPLTSRVKGYPFEVAVPEALPVDRRRPLRPGEEPGLAGARCGVGVRAARGADGGRALRGSARSSRRDRRARLTPATTPRSRDRTRPRR